MIRKCPVIVFVFIFLLVFFSSALELPSSILQVSDGNVINISLTTYNKSDEENQAFTQLVHIDKSANFNIEVNDIPPEVDFIIVQIHSYMYHISISSSKKAINEDPSHFVTGTNIGIFVELNKTKTSSVYVINENNVQVQGLVAIVAYSNYAPYPGGCNMEFDVKVSPFQKLAYDDATITVDAQPASMPKIDSYQPLCERYPLGHDAYRMYMLEQDPSNETYFMAIANMLTVRDIENNADFIPQSLYGSKMRRVYSLYPGTGSVYGMIARFTNHSSAYVPIVTYGCDPTSWSDSCTVLKTPFSKVMCALGIFLGCLVAVRGHSHFKISMFLIVTILGGCIGYTIGTISGTFDVEGTIIAAIGFGVFAGLIWLLLWLTFTSPMPSLILSSLTLGSFFFCLFYFTIPAGFLYLEVDAYFWMLYASFVTTTFMAISLIPLFGNIFCFTLVGSYATVFAIDHFSGSNLKYLVINGLRRATIPNFGLAVVEPPYQGRDVLLTFLWAFLVIIGLYKQCAASWNRAPFPPSPAYVSPRNERTPLLPEQRYQI